MSNMHFTELSTQYIVLAFRQLRQVDDCDHQPLNWNFPNMQTINTGSLVNTKYEQPDLKQLWRWTGRPNEMNDEQCSDPSGDSCNAYEYERLQRIAQNEARLRELGVAGTPFTLPTAARRVPRKKQPATGCVPLRRSQRQQGLSLPTELPPPPESRSGFFVQHCPCIAPEKISLCSPGLVCMILIAVSDYKAHRNICQMLKHWTS